MDDVVEVPLTDGLVALIDPSDADAVLACRWTVVHFPNVSYPKRGVRKSDGSWTRQALHTFLTGWHFVDHINGNGLDNRRANLRPATNAQNQRNRGPNRNSTSGRKGVTWNKLRKRWVAQIKADGRNIHLGYYADLEEAARAYDAAARVHHGEFAWFNFPEEVGLIATDRPAP